MGCNCIYIGRLQAVSCFVPPDNDYYTSATSGSPARSDRKRRQILQKIMLRGLFEGCSSFSFSIPLQNTYCFFLVRECFPAPSLI